MSENLIIFNARIVTPTGHLRTVKVRKWDNSVS